MTRLTIDARGVFVIAVTPFHPDGRIDMESCDRMVDFYLGAGATGLTVLGMMGEAPKLTIEEPRDVVSRILARVAGHVPVVVGMSAPGFAQIDALTRMVMDRGAAGVMVAPPGSLRTDDQIYNYYVQVPKCWARCRSCCRIFRSPPACRSPRLSSPASPTTCPPASVSSMRIGRGWKRSARCARRVY